MSSWLKSLENKKKRETEKGKRRKENMMSSWLKCLEKERKEKDKEN